MESYFTKLFNKTLNGSADINSRISNSNLVCNDIGMIEFELTDTTAASAIFSIIANTILSIISIMGNGLTIYVIAFCLGFTSFAFRGIFMISAISIFYSAVTQVMLTISRIHELFNYHNCQLKMAAALTGYICQCGIYTTVTALAIDRYIAVVHHNYYSVMKVHYIYATLSIITAIIWIPIVIISIVSVLPPTIFKGIVSSYLLIHSVVIVFTYIKLLIKLTKHNKNQVRHLQSSMAEEGIEKQRREEERRHNSVLFIIGVHTISMLAKAGCFAATVGLPYNYEVEYHCQRFIQFLVILNAAMYPFLYAWRIDALRKDMARVLKKTLCLSSAVGVQPNA